MEKEFVPYEQALELKELGFDGPCFGYYVDGELRGINLGIKELGGKEPYYQRFGFHVISNLDIDNDTKVIIAAPALSQAFRWFREKHNLFCEIQIDRTTAPKFCFNIFQYEHFGNYEDIRIGEWYLYRTYEEAELECLKELIEIAKVK